VCNEVVHRLTLILSSLVEFGPLMATFKVSNPEQFDFPKSEGWQKYVQRFERFRRASGLIDKDGTIQVNTLIYCMGSELHYKLDYLLPYNTDIYYDTNKC
jgi:hypothetical protein